MKVIELNRYIDRPVAEVAAVDTSGIPGALLLTDSSCVLPGRPLFIPEFAHRWELYLAPAVRICRLGKFIGRRFAHRYYDALSVVARLRPLDDGCDSALATAFDSSLMLGNWIDIDPSAAPQPITISWIGDMQTTIEPDAMDIDGAISRISEFCTLKTGDIIIPGRTSLARTPMLDTRVIADLGDKRVIEFNIK